MLIAHYEKKTQLYLRTTLARQNPLEPGKFLIPANATDILPVGDENYFNGSAWEVKENHIGKIVYLKSDPTKTDIIKTVGEIDSLYTLLVPIEYGDWDGEKWEVNQTLKTQAEIQTKIQEKFSKELNNLIWGEVKKNKDGDLSVTDLTEVDKKIK